MPRIPPQILDCVFYLYPNEQSAKDGRDFGGTGFFVGMPSDQFPNQLLHLYAVTNWHVACRDGHSVLRRMTARGPEIFPLEPDQWEFLAAYDIAAIQLSLPDTSFILTSAFLHPGMVGQHPQQVGVGDDVFMVGRFIDHDGGPINRPAARFGHVSVLPSPILQPNRVKASCFCVDLHSRTGYSGSPVLVYQTPYNSLYEEPHEPGEIRLPVGGSVMLLLGIHFAQFPELWELTDKHRISESHEPLITEGKYVKGLSGMTCVLPAWNILEVLNMPKLRNRRAKLDAEYAAKLQDGKT